MRIIFTPNIHSKGKDGYSNTTKGDKNKSSSSGVISSKKIVERFREIDGEMQAQAMAVLLKVAKSPLPIKVHDIAVELGLSQSTVSRNVAYLGDWNERKEAGHKLVEAYEDPAERRRKLVRLTAKGKRFVKSLNEIIYS